MGHMPKGVWAAGALVVITCGVMLWQGVFSGSGVVAPAVLEDRDRQQSPAAFSASSLSNEKTIANPDQNSPPAETDEIVVHVAGAVKKPGVVRIPRGSRVDDAVKAAGGFSSQADPDSVNLAQPLEDGVQVYVPHRGETVQVERRVGTARQSTVPEHKALPSGKININTANVEQLESLPGVGPATARAIIDYRTHNGGFSSVDELLEVRGIGPKKLEQIRPYVVVR